MCASDAEEAASSLRDAGTALRTLQRLGSANCVMEPEFWESSQRRGKIGVDFTMSGEDDASWLIRMIVSVCLSRQNAPAYRMPTVSVDFRNNSDGIPVQQVVIVLWEKSSERQQALKRCT